MKLFAIYIFSTCLLFVACNGSGRSDKNQGTTAAKPSAPTTSPGPKWLYQPRLNMAINTLLSHKRGAFRCDSAIIVNYNGVFGEHTYLPVNAKGQWIRTITSRKKLTALQLKTLNSIIGNPASFRAPINMGCVKPTIGIIYFKDGRVIALSALSLECVRVRSTAQLGSNDHRNLFNKKALKRIEKFYYGLKW